MAEISVDAQQAGAEKLCATLRKLKLHSDIAINCEETCNKNFNVTWLLTIIRLGYYQ